MLYIDDEQNITLTRGDTGIFNISLQNQNGKAYTPQEGDTLRFALSDGSSSNYVVASYTLDLPSIDYNLNTNEKEDLTLVFSHKKFDTNNFIVFNNSENGVKILI